ncbi:amino acid/amide ABC transporter membrane protein 2 (HAAT family) [Comamonas sp. BIGb0124]|uniref:branched-chain amino acid ABC transporter permease n=1 Tax=Comamonas sp. BIGb0124 TaxID=2485130 RepID=UPI000F473CCA|nr:branched-chain amino acid ABC transporter permease [Comamonas sp. BIGb0124]ROR23075.1 amino acid/amide ABC transporter membrane protein 2 (HAAT family) [Comamonas sp. BIGb0124]
MSQTVDIRIALPAIIALAMACYLLFPDYLGLFSSILIVAIFALSYDLLQGYAGIVSLGHAVFFGLGAYTVAILGSHGVSQPLLTLLAAMAVGGLAAGILAPIVVIGNDLTRLLVTLGIGFLFHEAANQLRGLTGGADGLSSFEVAPVAGVFPFDFSGHTAFFYTLTGLVAAYLFVWRVTTSPFGLALRGLRENTSRMHAIGAAVTRHRAMAYVLSGGIAGMSGAMLAQTNNFASLDMLGFERSAEVMMMTAIGGTGSIPGVIFGSALFAWMKDALSSLSPKYWQLGVGLVLMVSVFVLPQGLAGVPAAIKKLFRRRA